ncbi:DNA polymerase III subunit delta' [Pseudochrobactrum sp. sp1633]|uniref:DNA polymerase III subunit delta' n=1 Tax=Pseudochrobactrum sp. sp1633 TaxID=3036706 RepID=UPI0025A4FC47|nr:DNA polymerase III subunit delta' [Pseudochrobactrum sp. sp1633]MDM8346761.1 DNA polymerase III subunit delta' [Pseudochrobactrum sp. sp1633]HWD13319.1 DNA polymerase III subunit delta' [Pseudochrobactrum sp.]
MAEQAPNSTYDEIQGVAAPNVASFLTAHEDVRGFLAQAYQEGRMHHALLFEGLQGIGKATTGFHLAGHMLQYPQGASAPLQLAVPELDKAPYRQISQGMHPALLHITRPFDAKTGKYRTAITVEEIRRITHFLSRTSGDGAWRIIIIDPADDMNRNAANALLKTLEEPPARALFILISHSSGRLLPTIRSRCQSLAFKPLNDAELKRALDVAGKDVGIDVQDQAYFAALSARAEGSVRKALLLVAHGGLEITDTVDAVLSGNHFDLPKAQALAAVLGGREAEVQNQLFLEYLLDKAASQALGLAEQGQVVQASQWSQFWDDLRREAMETESYNLDRKQAALIMMEKMHRAMRSGMPV